jgi:hypothetical protein
MKQHRKNREDRLTVNAICCRVLRIMRKALTEEPVEWTPFESVPVSVSLADLRNRETAG